MAQITSGVGLISGIDTSQIIDELVSLDSAPITLLQNEINTGTEQKDAFTQLTTDLNSLQTVGKTLSNPQTFGASTANSSDQSTLTATAGNGAAVGTYQLQVARLVSSQQAVTNGFADPSQTKVGAGTLTISEGGGELNTPTALSSLNGGQGVTSGQIRITDRSGKSQIVDLSSAVTLDDVAQDINNSLDISVRASVTQNGLVLTDETGQTASNLVVQDVGTGHTAEQLGLAGSAASNTLTGTPINTIGTATALSQLNGGNGVSTSDSGPDFQITAGDGSTFSISLANDATLGDVISNINAATGGKVTAAVNSSGTALQLTGTGGGTVSVAALNGSKAATDLGILGSGSGTLTGSSLSSAIDTTLISSLNGGQGIPLGQISITDRSGDPATTIDLSGARTVDDIIDDINNAGAGVEASLNASSDGVQLTDTSGGTGALTIADVNSTTAAALGIAGTFAASTPVVSGANLHAQYISANTDLSTLNGGKGISQGAFTITSSNGQSTQVNLSSGNFTTLGDLITTINARAIGVTASINSTGNGLLLTDTAGGSGTLSVEDTTGTPAADLNLIPSGSTKATATNGKIDGAYQATVTVTANDTLQTVEQKINSLGFGVTASIINDGSGATPYRLSLTADNSGQAGRFTFDAGTTGLTTRNLVQAQDAAVFLGGQGSSNPLLITSNSNQITNVVSGVTISLLNVSAAPVTLTVARDPTAIGTQLQSFVSDFNTVVTALNSYTAFDTTSNTGGVLLGDETTQTIQEDLYNIFDSVVKNAGQYKIFSDVGITIGDGATLSFDQNAFNAAYAADPTAVQNLFSQATTGLGNVINNTVTDLTDPSNGLITLETQTIDQRNTQFQSRITELDNIIAQKKELLTEQFANMEQVLAQLQSQQQALGSLSGSKSTTSSSSGGGSAASSSGSSSSDSSGSSSSSTGSSGSTDSSASSGSSGTSGSTSGSTTGS